MSIIVLVLFQVLLVIGLSRLVGLGFRWLRQPLVIGEIVAGIMLGPSLFGMVAPGLAVTLFPPETVPFLNVLSQVGLIFFMFLIGLELNPRYLKGHLETAILISHVSIIVPFAFGTVLSLLLYPLVSNASVSFTAFALFLGAAMSITAFPVLARIITENNLQGSRLGTLALTCAAVDDVTAWCILALAIAVTRTNNIAAALPTIFEALIYIGFMLTVGRWFLKRLSEYCRRTGKLSQFVLAGIYMGVVASALVTEIIGIHLIFGAFLLGVAMPKDNPSLTRELAEKTEDFVLTFLLPIFFAYSGLRTQIGLLNRPELWWLCLVILVVAISGKYIGTYVAARVSGMQNQEASALGWLMNTRGLTELIVLNIGLSLGVISPLLFTMLVIMALVTTFMTSPLLEMTYAKSAIRQDLVEAVELPDAGLNAAAPTYRVLVPVANPHSQRGLVQLATAIAGSDQPVAVTPLSLIQIEEDYAFGSTPLEVDRRLAEQQQNLQLLIASLEPSAVRAYVHPVVRVGNDVARETAQIAELEQANLVLVGWHRPAFSSNRLGGRVGQILSTAKTDVAVFIDRQHKTLERILLPYSPGIHTDLGLELALRILFNQPNSYLTVLRVTAPDQPAAEFSYEFHMVMQRLPLQVQQRIQVETVESHQPLESVIQASKAVDLTIVGASREWGIERQTLGQYSDALAVECFSSLLIARCYSQVTPHLATVLTAVNQAAQPDQSESDQPGASI
jgi:Kef-type K+ transport system membrane component KefB/nucleotide-binding universal stress UspA family protein